MRTSHYKGITCHLDGQKKATLSITRDEKGGGVASVRPFHASKVYTVTLREVVEMIASRAAKQSL